MIDFMLDDELQEELEYILSLNGEQIAIWWESLGQTQQDRAHELLQLKQQFIELEQALYSYPECQIMPESNEIH
jgi:hypothetical protein